MAFTGTATVKQVADGIFRITGLSLSSAASGTIGFTDKTSPAEVSLSAPMWQPYKNAHGELVTLQDAVQVLIAPTTDVTDVIPVSVVKSGTDHTDFAITLHNDTAGGPDTPTGDLEIWVQFHE